MKVSSCFTRNIRFSLYSARCDCSIDTDRSAGNMARPTPSSTMPNFSNSNNPIMLNKWYHDAIWYSRYHIQLRFLFSCATDYHDLYTAFCPSVGYFVTILFIFFTGETFILVFGRLSHIRPVGTIPESKVHGAYMGPTWGRQDPGGPHVGPMNLAIRDVILLLNIVSKHSKTGGILNIEIWSPTVLLLGHFSRRKWIEVFVWYVVGLLL